MLNSRFVVPVGASVDNVSTFSTLQAALTRPGLTAGDVIQIDRGSAPGTIHNADLPALPSLTIRGDPGSTAANLPAFTVADSVTIDSSRAGFTLANVNVVLQGGLTFNANGAVVSSFLASNFTGAALTFNGTLASVLRDSQLIAHNGAGGAEVVRVNAAAGSSNLISNNTISSDATVSENLLFYSGASTIGDQVVNNTFVGNTGAASLALLLVGPGVSGLTIRGNTFSDTNSNRTALTLLSGGQNTVIADNTITLTGAAGTIGISLMASSTSAVTSAIIADNRITTSGNGVGIQLTTNTGALNVRIEGNDFHFNAIGVLIDPSHTTDSVTGIDLGGGSQGSRGANNFRGFGSTSGGSGAIVEGSSFSTAQTIMAHFDLFAVSNPRTVVLDSGAVGGAAVVDTSGNLVGNAAFVETLYLKYLHRVGDVSSSSDAGSWVAALNAGLPRAAVIGGIINSSEALGITVSGLYRHILNRQPSAAETAGWVSYLQQGGKVEQVMGLFLSSAEYQGRFGDDSSFVQGVYGVVLGRTASSGELAFWAGLVPQVGRAGVVNDLLGTQEYRGLVVRQDYAALLERFFPPSPAEVAGWVGLGLDQLTLAASLSASSEFFTHA